MTSSARIHRQLARAARAKQAASLKMARPRSAWPAVSSTLVAILCASHRLAQCASTQLTAAGGGAESPPPASPDETPPGELHFGAKVALSLLTATIALVAVATLLDYQTTTDERRSQRRRTASRSRDGSANNHCRLLFGKRESAGLRDYRSLSMSSSCSSSLFCYTNSVASSAAYLGQVAGSHQQDNTFALAPQTSQECLASQQHYESNLQLHFLQEQTAVSKAGQPLAPFNLPAAAHFGEESNKLETNCSAGPATHYQRESEGGALQSCGVESRGSEERLVTRRRRRRAELLALANQLVLAFSLRQSARQIFGGAEARACATSDKWPAASDGAAPILTSGAMAPDQNKCAPQEAARCKTRAGAHQSFDSLHGLRFLSMIWVIVIHSYNFALRWMFFSNATTLDSIYKSAASQLIANGSFACDSFFFVGGFLLPYSAFVADESSLEAPAETRPATSERQDEAEDSKRGGSASASGTTAAARDQQVAPCSGVGERLESGTGCCCSYSCSYSCCASSSCCCCCCCCYYCAQQLHGCSRLGPLDAGASQVHARASCAGSGASLIGVSDNISPKAGGLAARPCQAASLVGGAGGPHACQRPCCTHWPTRQQQREQEQEQEQEQEEVSANQVREQERNTNERARGVDNRRPAASEHAPVASGGSQKQQQRPNQHHQPRHSFTLKRILANIVHRYVRMMPLMMAIIGLCASLLRYLGEGPLWADSTLMYDAWCRKNWWINAMFLHNFVKRENMCLSHSWYSAVDLQLFLVGQLVLFVLSRSRRAGLALLLLLIGCSQVITISLTLAHRLPAVPLVSSVDERTMNLYYGEIYIKPYCRASPYLIGLLLAYLMRTTQLERLQLRKWQIGAGWTLSLGAFAAIILAMQPAMNGHSLSALESALYSGLSRPIWALATGWMIFACITKRGGPVARLLSARCFVPLSKLTYPAFLIHPIVMALFYGSRQSSFHFSHYLMLYLILGNIVITYASAFILAALFELPMLSVERAISGRLFGAPAR